MAFRYQSAYCEAENQEFAYSSMGQMGHMGHMGHNSQLGFGHGGGGSQMGGGYSSYGQASSGYGMGNQGFGGSYQATTLVVEVWVPTTP
ncbi:Pre-mRNA-processing factor 39 [Bienertia sinuspersici]